ncbi:hypothetical protein [Psychrobacter sp. CAL346-MNA-CIBAN-0220]|uniref:hypothetical protein n=1 Tax=Psychrobacter sp. CAL346-MNA-CIBAN-0220 TaxID=3140457 RepID=UPI0033253CA5
MSIIEQLEKTVTSAVLDDNDSVAHISLLEQFYAVLIARLALPQVYSQLLRTDRSIAAENIAESPLFEQLWQDINIRQIIIQELAATHHIDEVATTQLLMDVAPLVYRQLKALANGQLLTTFLQGQELVIRQYLPAWSAPVIDYRFVDHQAVDNLPISDQSTATTSIVPALIGLEPITTADTGNLEDVDSVAKGTDTVVDGPATNADAIHANLSAYHLSEGKLKNREKVKARNQRVDVWVGLLLLIVALTAIVLVWALVIKPDNIPPIKSMATVPVVTPPTTELPLPILTSVELIIGVDDSGSLYTCSASVGDASLQDALKQALDMSFGTQAQICDLVIQEGVARSIPNINIKMLPTILTLLKSAPFARLHLQNDSIILAAPDDMILQRLLTDIRTLVPAIVVSSVAPIQLPNDTTNSLNANKMPAITGLNNELEANPNRAASNKQYNNANVNTNNEADYQASDDDTGDSVTPRSSLRNYGQNSTMTRDAPSARAGTMSLSEVEDLASNVIVAEPAQGGRPVDRNITSNR